MAEGIVREFGMDMYTPLYLKWITNKDLLSRTGNSAQCYVSPWGGGGVWERMDTRICVAKHFHCSPETITTFLISHVHANSHWLLCPRDSPGKNTGVGCHSLLQGTFPTQGSNPHLSVLMHWPVGSFSLAPRGRL